FSETHLFEIETNGGVRDWFDEDLVVDDWPEAAERVLTFSRDLVAGVHYEVVVEYQRRSGATPRLGLRWSGFSLAEAIVPQSQWVSGLEYPAFAATPSAAPASGTYPDFVRGEIFGETAGSRIHYTLDGSEPTEASPTYAEPM